MRSCGGGLPPDDAQDCVQAFFIVEPNGRQLAYIARSLEAGELRCFVGTEAPLASASDAYQNAVPKHRPGKVVITLSL